MVTSCPADGEVGVWHAEAPGVFADAARRARAEAWLTPAERTRYDRFRFDHDRDMFLLGRAMARALVGRALAVGPTTWAWSEGSWGRPEIGGHSTLSFNIAHSDGTVACAIGRRGAVGIDIESRRRPLEERVVRRFCSPPEIADCEAQGADGWRARFLLYWTLKEAYLKACGLGISMHLADVSFRIVDGRPEIDPSHSPAGKERLWALDLASIAEDFVIAVAAAVPDGECAPRFVVEPMPLSLLP
jgi:4'-phosphopantetheinyl transferase